MAKKPPRLGGELPAYTTMGATKHKKTRRVMAFPYPLSSIGSSKTVQRSPRENIGTPGTSKFVQRAPQENTDMRGTIKFAQRLPANSSQRKPSVMPGNSSQRMPSVMPGNSSQRMPATFRAPRKPTK